MKLLHTADWHLGKGYSAFPRPLREKLRQYRLDGVEAILSYARRKGIRYVLSAGDQIDSADARSEEPVQQLYALLRKYPEVRIIALGGNHDPITAYSPYDRVEDSLAPPNFHLVRGAEVLPLEETGGPGGRGVIVYAASLHAKFGTENPILTLCDDVDDSKRPDAVRIGLAHGSLMLPNRYKEDDFPIPVDACSRCRFDYLALGHWHSRYIHDERIAYPGTHQKMGYGDLPGVLEVELPAAGGPPVATPVQLDAGCKWREEAWEVDDASLEDLIESVLQPSESLIRRVKVRGTLSPSRNEELLKALDQASHGHLHLESELDVDTLPGEEDIAGLRDYGLLADTARSLAGGEAEAVSPVSEALAGEIEEGEIRSVALNLLFRTLKEQSE